MPGGNLKTTAVFPDSSQQPLIGHFWNLNGKFIGLPCKGEPKQASGQRHHVGIPKQAESLLQWGTEERKGAARCIQIDGFQWGLQEGAVVKDSYAVQFEALRS